MREVQELDVGQWLVRVTTYICNCMTNEAPPIARQYRDKRVLVVEESWHVASAMKLFLESLGMTIAMAGRLEDAERLIVDDAFDLAVMDVNVRDQTTYELMDRLRRQGAYVIAVTGYPLIPVSAPSADAILQKPASRRELLAALAKVSSIRS